MRTLLLSFFWAAFFAVAAAIWNAGMIPIDPMWLVAALGITAQGALWSLLEPLRSKHKCLRRWTLVASAIVFAAAVGVWEGWLAFAKWGSDDPRGIAKLLRAEIAESENQIRSYEAGNAFLRNVPPDADLVVRDLKIDSSSPSSVILVGPKPGDRYRLAISKWEDRGDGVPPIAKMCMDGTIGGVHFDNEWKAIEIGENRVNGPIQAGNFEFYVIVEEESVRGVAKLAVVRRFIREMFIGNGFTFSNTQPGCD